MVTTFYASGKDLLVLAPLFPKGELLPALSQH